MAVKQHSTICVDDSAVLSAQNLIGVGIFTSVHRISPTLVRKVPREAAPDSLQAIQTEARIYKLLNGDDHIAICTSAGRTVDFVDLRWAEHGTLSEYIENNTTGVDDDSRIHMTTAIIEAVRRIHKHHIIHSDLALRQFLLYGDMSVRLSDFAASGYDGQPALGMENASHFMPRDDEEPNTVASDLFALGSTLYELWKGETPYDGKEDDEIQALYTEGRFPILDQWPCADIIHGCWHRRFSSADDVLLEWEDRIAVGGRTQSSSST